jgi:hypothetical protein
LISKDLAERGDSNPGTGFSQYNGLANLPAFLIRSENFGLYYFTIFLKQLQREAVDPFVPDLSRFERRPTTLLLHRVYLRIALASFAANSREVTSLGEVDEVKAHSGYLVQINVKNNSCCEPFYLTPTQQQFH